MNIKTKAAPRQQKQPKRITQSYLHNAGLYYLQRYATSSGNFRKVMMRKVRKSCQFHADQDLSACTDMVENLVQKFQDSGLLNDQLYTSGAVNSLRRQGKSRNSIIQKLQIKGVDNELAKQTLTAHDTDIHGEDITAEREAALTFARKKRIGPYRPADHENLPEDQKRKQEEKAVASMARAGFNYDTIRFALNFDLTDQPD